MHVLRIVAPSIIITIIIIFFIIIITITMSFPRNFACPFPAILLVSTQSCWAAGFKQDDPAHGFDKKTSGQFHPQSRIIRGNPGFLGSYLDPHGGGQTPSNPISQHETEWCRFYREWVTKTNKKGQQQCGKYTSTKFYKYLYMCFT